MLDDLCVHFLDCEPDGDFAEPNYWHVFASEWVWRPGVLDSILRLVADDVVRDLMVLHPGAGG
jgi:hypothetical protein